MKTNHHFFILKTVFSAVIIFCFFFQLFAQAPQQFNYQTVVRNALSEPLENQNVSFRISIIPDSPNNTPVFTETHSATTNSLGLVSLAIGGGTIVTGSIAGINWSDGVFFLEISVDEQGGSNYQLMGSSQLLSVPYALFAGQTGTQPSLGSLPDVQLQQPQTGEVLQFNGTAWTNVPLCSLGTYFYADADGDGLGNRFSATFVLSGCTAPAEFVANNSDCNDGSSSVGFLTWYRDNDGDTYGNPLDSVISCTQPQGYVFNKDDCEDSNPNLPIVYFRDLDEDGFGDLTFTMLACSQPFLFTDNPGDCEDGNPAVNPGVVEICDNGIDDNCDGIADCDDSNCSNTLFCNPCLANPCDDGNPCTIDLCINVNGIADCSYTTILNSCQINGQCVPEGTTNPNVPCQECNPTANEFGWSNKANGTPCDVSSSCLNGVCVPD